MEQETSIHIKLKEGGASNYMKAISSTFGGQQTDSHLVFMQGNSRMQLSTFNFVDEFDLIVAQVNYHKDIIIEREPDNRPDYYHFNLINQGQVKQSYEDNLKYTEAGSANGIFLYNGLFPFTSVFNQRSDTQTIGYKFSKKAMQEFFPDAIELLDALFGDEEPKAYHTGINTELDRKLDELFHCENSNYGRIPLVMAKGLEIIPLLMKTLKSQLDKDELKGLHIDDYKRILKIKDYLLDHLEDKVNIEALADKYAISLSKLKRDFKALYDTSIYKFYTHAKMDEAYRRLRSGQFAVTEVGYDLGYQSISKFSLMFKKVKGINPSDVVPL